MARQAKHELHEIVVKAITECNWDILYAANIVAHPFVLKIYHNPVNYLLRIYIWNLTHGGGLRSADEYRIQITGVSQFERNNGEKTLILGWWEEVGIFAGFDYEKHKGILGKSPSIQIKQENLKRAAINGFSPCNKGNGEIAIAFRPDYFIYYVENLEHLHQIGEDDLLIELVEKIAEGNYEVNKEQLKSLAPERQSALVTISQKLREGSFSRRILTAYRNTCAFSGIQLNLVEAAHIYPVSETLSTDETSNGIALSPLYHRAFERGLITIDDQYTIIINEDKLNKLLEMDFAGGINKFRGPLRSKIILPHLVGERPNIHLIRKANKLRGWDL